MIQWNEAQLSKLYSAYQARGPLPPPVTLADFADEFEYVNLVIDVLEDPWKIIDGEVPFTWGFLADGAIQYAKDFNRADLSILQKLGRSGIVAFEGALIIQPVSYGVGSGVGLVSAMVVTELGQPYLTLVSYPTGKTVGYVATNLYLSKRAEWVNENFIFPWLHLSPQPSQDIYLPVIQNQ